KAVRLFNDVLKIDPQNVKARINLGNVYLSTQDLVEAEKIYRSAISLDTKDISPRLNLGVVYYKQGDFVKAKTEWEKLLADNPNNVRVLSVIGSAYLEQRNYDKAIEIFKQISEVVPDNGSIANTLGYLLAEQNVELELAEKLIEKAIKLDKVNRATYYDSLAWVYYRQGKYDKAYEILDRALKIFRLSHSPVSTDVHYHMGKLRELKKDFELAKESYRLAIKSNTDKETVRLASESLHLIENR
ncbi:MAG: tetratricopeptide repeat protein, partial [Candidatus Riflebacteria bacterium]|nr:tetratricopeptide repeat protein [Candidatus Riflebacteria bacterium]